MSSVSGLKVRPNTAMVLPATLPPQAAMTRSAICASARYERSAAWRKTR